MPNEWRAKAAALRRSRKIWGQRVVGIVLGAMAGSAVGFSLDFGEHRVLKPDAAKAAEPQFNVAGSASEQSQASAASGPNVEIMHLIVTRARYLMLRGELQEAERLLSAAEMLVPGNPRLAETWRLFEVMKARLEFANSAPAAGPEEPLPRVLSGGQQ